MFLRGVILAGISFWAALHLPMGKALAGCVSEPGIGDALACGLSCSDSELIARNCFERFTSGR